MCFSEHWLNDEQINILNIEHYKLADNFCRVNDKHGGSCIFVDNKLVIRDVNWTKDSGRDKEFEISPTELVDHRIVLICIYTSPQIDVNIFLEKLVVLINRVQKRGKYLVLCRDRNINLLLEDSHQQAFINLLLSNNLINIVSCPTRVTNHSSS